VRSRFVSEDPAGLPWSAGLSAYVDSAGSTRESNLYPYASNTPLNRLDPLGLADILYNSKSGALWVIDKTGQVLGEFPAANNAQRGSRGPWPEGMYGFDYWKAHPESGTNGRFGPNGNFVFKLEGCAGCGIHSGRRDQCDLANRCGVRYATDGCIRTTDEAMELMRRLHGTGDPIKHLWVVR
jgi:hypothetical protein